MEKKDQYYFSFLAAIFPPYACLSALPVCSQYNERILFQQKGTSRWYTQSTPIHHRRASVFPRPFPAADCEPNTRLLHLPLHKT